MKNLQQEIIKNLESISKLARKIKKKKKCTPGQTTGPCSGKLDTQLFPEWWATHPRKAYASSTAKAMFFKQPIEKDSYWVIQYKEDEVKLNIGDLFNKGIYDVSEIKSKEFGIALILRLTKGNIKEEAKKLIDENKLSFTEISSEEIRDVEKITNMISYAIPLNEYQRNIRDSIMEKSIGVLIQHGN